MNESKRSQQLQAWLMTAAVKPVARIEAVAQDASVRRYWRIYCSEHSYIVMDTPPDELSCQPFIDVARILRGLGLNVPEIIASDIANGFLLLTDLGEQQYLERLNSNTVNALYQDALTALMQIQLNADPHAANLPVFDRAFLLRELAIFRDWFVLQYLNCQLTADEQLVLEQTFQCLSDSALEQPQVWMHRDYHSRNLMVTDQHNPGILDFQDSVIGPITYDLVSLLRDCYIDWPVHQVEQWVLQYCGRLQAHGVQGLQNDKVFLRWFDLMGMQRHLKAIGLFARLKLRDGKSQYLADIPRTYNYVMQVAARYAELKPMHQLLQHWQAILP